MVLAGRRVERWEALLVSCRFLSAHRHVITVQESVEG